VLNIAQVLNPHEEKESLDLKKASLLASMAFDPQPLGEEQRGKQSGSKQSGSNNTIPTDSITSQVCKMPLSDSAPITEDQEPPIQAVTPCKLLTRFAADLNADIARETDGFDEVLVASETGGVECSRAYGMLRGFATTEAKLDAIAHTLERGCEKTKGGCRVRNENIWKALDQVIE
jgi:hypothetical protein